MASSNVDRSAFKQDNTTVQTTQQHAIAPNNFAVIRAACGSPPIDPIPNESGSLNCVGYKLQSDVYMDALTRKTPENVVQYIRKSGKLNARVVLAEYGSGRKLNVAFNQVNRSGPPGGEVFAYEVVIEERSFPLAAAFKQKDAREKAAANAIEVLIKEGRV